ncbi:right-handed parallel beta-helix repeat-containing protein [Mesobacillus foraminis]|uniref:right-handed parallel beta-helix repeat-containing protein n=1 Tax=Mesobacillus foraminis TaxID=279826 RepID=UPI00214BB6FE|nr:right-handed parallel beta-helix repeat-containing protein [Mesobacillus foraminis]
MYLIELDRWNIKQGLPSKPYINADYIRADANIQGINNAIHHASANGFTKIVLPRGQYAICYPREIKMVSGITFDLNGSTLKVIYDSDRKSPFDTRTTTDYYNFKGNSFLFENVTNAHLSGGTIIGCRDDRSFKNPAEVAMEHTYGVVFSKGTNYSSIKNSTIRDYMGDNITFNSDSIGGLVEFNQGLTLNRLDYTTGQPTSSTNTVITRYIDLPQNLIYSTFIITGAGYTRLTNLNSKDFDVFFYDQNNNFLGVLKRKKIYTDISIPVAAKKFRLLFYNETNPSKYMQITIRWGRIPHHNVIEHSEIFNGHRGGITLGGSYNVIQHNVIRDNGKGSNSFLDRKPIFNDPTRYSINQEDSYGDNLVIRNNLIYGSNHGILAGCYSIQIENNHIYNMESTGINLYSLMYANVKGNVIYNCSAPLGLMNSNFVNAYVNFSGNFIQGGSMYVNLNNAYTLNISNNYFVDVLYINMGSNSEKNLFNNNHVIFQNLSGTPIITVNKIENCYFASTILRSVTFRVYKQTKCTFSNININMQTLNGVNMNEKVTIENCEYNKSMLTNHIFMTKGRELKVTNSKFIDTVVKVGNINTAGSTAITILKDCDLVANTIKNLFATDFNQPSGMIKLDQSNIEISNPTFSVLIDHDKITKSTFTLFLKECNFTYTGTSQLNLAYYDSTIPMIKFISANNTFNNITLPTEDPNIFIGYDPNNTYKTNVTLQSNGDKYTAVINHNLNTLEPYVFCTSDISEIVQPVISIISHNSIMIKHTEHMNLLVIVKKIP